jgi:hypothetical protein
MAVRRADLGGVCDREEPKQRSVGRPVLASTAILGFLAFTRSGAVESARRIVEEIAAAIDAAEPDTQAAPPAPVNPPSSSSP